MIDRLTRAEWNSLLAGAIAHHNVGNHEKARHYGIDLVSALRERLNLPQY